MFGKSLIKDSSFMGISQISYMLAWSKPYILRYRGKLIFLLFLVAVSVGLSLVQVDVVRSSIDAVLVRDWRLLVTILLRFIGVTALWIVQRYVYGHFSNQVEANMTRDARVKYTQTVLDAQMLRIEKESSGDLITLHNEDIPVAIGFIKEVYSNFLLNPLMAIGGFIYLMHFNWQLSIMVFLPIPFITLFLNHVSNRASRIYVEIMDSRGEYTQQISDISRGMETIKACNMQENRLDKVRNILEILFSRENRYNRIDIVAMVLIMTVSYLPQIIALVYGGFLVLNGVLPVSVLVAYHLLIQRVNTPTVNIFTSLHAVKNSLQSMRRLDRVLNIPPERKDGSAFKDTGTGAVIRLKNIDFSYGDRQVLRDISLDLPRGKCIGIAGDSGAGKSTIINLVCGFYPVDTSGVSVFREDISGWNLVDLRSNIAYVSQDSYILPETLLENIRYGRPESSIDEVTDAAYKAGLVPFIDSLPDGLDTVLSESGSNLSGGQRQRISLARAALKDASIYIFDEPTSSLDPETEKFVIDNIIDLMTSKSVIVISHSINTLRICDQVYLVQEGVITETGTVEDLLAEEGRFYELFGKTAEVER
ncbi:MAG: ABC transporter ATP-binding protein [Dehalococcoidales bacterium]|nr:ABC transporter ATP-binding protein [Dehalococcoidales bacterium]